MIRAFAIAVSAGVLTLNAVKAATIRVPQDQQTIQAAFDVSFEGDTILVANGVYVEALSCPPHGFTLLGDVAPDTGLYSRPIIDPSSLPNSDSLACMGKVRGDVVVERIWFRNDWRMYPHNVNTVGGVHCTGANSVFRDCVFDSTYRGLVAIGQDVTAERCTFLKSVGHCVRATGSLIARNCSFEVVDNEWSTVLAGNRSLIESCEWHGYMGTIDWWLVVYGEDYVVRNNVFGPGGGSFQPLVRLGGVNGEFHGNLFTGAFGRGPLLGIGAECRASMDIHDNSFLVCELMDTTWNVPTAISAYAETDSDGVPCGSVYIHDNVVDSISGGWIARAMLASTGLTVTHNIFRNLERREEWAIDSWDHSLVFSDNLISGTSTALGSEFGVPVNAENNWWGHWTGPYNPFANPDGQGDRVTDVVDFTPWYPDTFFFRAAPEPSPPLPDRATLLAYPNPFNSETTLKLTVPRATIARVEVFDVMGRRVAELWNRPALGTETIRWSAAGFASGIYFVRAWDPLGNRPLAVTKIVQMK